MSGFHTLLTLQDGTVRYRQYTLREGRFGWTDRWAFEHDDYDGAGPDYVDHRCGHAPTLYRAIARIDDLCEEYKPECECGADPDGDCRPTCPLEEWRIAERESEGLDATPSELR